MAKDRLGVLLDFYRMDSSDAFTRFALAQEYARRGELGRALAFYEDLLAEAPDYTGTYYHLGKLYLRTGRPQDAAATFRRGLEAAARVGHAKDLSELHEALHAPGVR